MKPSVICVISEAVAILTIGKRSRATVLLLPLQLVAMIVGIIALTPANATPSYHSYLSCGVVGGSLADCTTVSQSSSDGLLQNQVLAVESKFPEPTPFYSQGQVRSGYGELGVRTAASVGGTISQGVSFIGNSESFAYYTDSISVRSSSLATGTPITLNVTTNVSVSYKRSGILLDNGSIGSQSTPSLIISSGFASTGSFGYVVNFGNGPVGSTNLAFNDVLTLKVGDTIEFTPALRALVKVGMYDFASNYPTFDGQATGEVQAMNSLHTYFSSGDGVTLVSGSGHDYSLSAVPETSTILLMSLGLCAVGFKASRGRRSAGIGAA